MEGVLSHEMKKHFIDGNRVIINKEAGDQHVEEVEFQVVIIIIKFLRLMISSRWT
jgi:hypothetical protein